MADQMVQDMAKGDPRIVAPIRRRVLVAALAVTIGALAAAILNRATWAAAEPRPTAAAARAVALTGMPGAAIEQDWHDDIHDGFWYADHPHGTVGRQRVGVDPAGQTAGLPQDVRRRLSGSGWKVDRVDADGLVVSRGSTVAEWSFPPASPGSWVEVWVWTFEPWWVTAGSLAGWLIGGVAGWWIGGRVLRLAGRAGRISAVVVTVLVAVLGLSTVLTLGMSVHDFLPVATWGSPSTIWISYTPFLWPFGFTLG